MDNALIRTGGTLLVFAAAALIVGLVFGPAAGWASFSVGLLALLLYHVRHVHALSRWLNNPDPERFPVSHGIWDDIFALLYRFERAAARQERELAGAVARWRQAGQALPDGVVILAVENRIEWCNETAEAHFGLNGRTDVGQPIINLIRQPGFVAYAKSGDFSKPIQLRAGPAGKMLLSVQLIRYGEEQKLLLSRIQASGAPSPLRSATSRVPYMCESPGSSRQRVQPSGQWRKPAAWKAAARSGVLSGIGAA